MHAFRCATLSPVDLSHARLATATAHAGGVGLLDAAHTPLDRLAAGRANLHAALTQAPTGPDASIGLRLRVGQLDLWRPLLDELADRGHWILLCDWTAESLPMAVAALSRRGSIVWAEIRSTSELEGISASLPLHGWAACGAECGGFTGRESAFILAQHLARQPRPFLVRGGIGVHTAAACRVAGAAGVILDDAVLLLRESPLPPRFRHRLRRLGLADTQTIGGPLDAPMRVVDRPDWPASRVLRDRAGQAGWRGAIDELVGWDDPERRAWPIGEGAARAAATARQYTGVARLVRAVRRSVDDHLAVADRERPLAPDAPLARDHGTRYPIVQGPMTRVSDRAEFAAAVAEAGALPMLALALMRKDEVEPLLGATRDALAGRPWGVGILGFVPDDLRTEQLDVVARVKPPFALIAGGRPSQAASLESRGITTYLHTPAPLLEMFLDAGARRFVFEGAECGGHTGPLHSFSLWDYVVDTLAARPSSGEGGRIDVLFAGGIHDALSAAMVAALSAPLSARGIGVGVLMGSAYLFAREAVATKAITETFQRQAIACRGTATIETGPGHVIRCAPTPFVQTFAEQDLALRHTGLAGQELRDALERLIVGRSRIASKGLERDGDELRAVAPSQQIADGLFMVGDLASLRDAPTDMATLHAAVSIDGTRRIQEIADAVRPSSAAASRPPPVDVAIVGAACFVPGARTPETFWRNLLGQACMIQEIPHARWDWRLYYDPGVAARDRIISKWGGFIDAVPFDPVTFGIPPKSLSSITLPQLLALELTRRALLDAGYTGAAVDPDTRARTAVVFGIANTADVSQLYATRATLPLLVPRLGDAVLDRLPEWTEESYPGLLTNVVAGRVANRFDFGGPNFTVDAACASSIAAVDLAVQEVASGRSDLAVVGGLECEQTPHAYLGFSHTRALSPRGRADVFDRRADGIVISEGGVVLVLKRLHDATRDGDRIYAVIKGIGGSSDGRGRSLTAPRPDGQRLAFRRAYDAAAIDPATIGLYEAHATGTAVGDAAEVETINRVLSDHGGRPGACVIGSAKSLVGHTRSAAGMVAILKAALALHHRVLPPHAGASEPLPQIAAPDAPVRLLSTPAPWLTDPRGPRRAGVSAFGFGGANYHAVLEEFTAPHAAEPAPLGATEWPAELFAFSATDAPALIDRLHRLDRAAQGLDECARRGGAIDVALRDLAYTCTAGAADAGAWRVAVVAGTPAELRECLRVAERALAGDAVADSRVFVGSSAPPGRLAFLFPGQGSQYPGMGAELALYAAELRSAFEAGDRIASEPGEPLSRLILPAAAFTDASTVEQARRLTDTRAAQPAIGVVSCGMLDFARRLNINPDVVAGHSYGEFVALHAAGSLAREDLLAFSLARGRAMAGNGDESGVMAAVELDEAGVSTFLDDDNVVIANCNAPDQTVLAGARGATSAVIERLREAGHSVVPLAVSAAFHSPLMAAARPRLASALASLPLQAPTVPVYGNLDGRPYPSGGDDIRRQLAAHLECRVNFLAQIEEMYAAGVRLFVEVGPGRVLTGLVNRTLRDRPHVAIAADGGLRSWLAMVARVFVEGRKPDLDALFAGRPAQWVDLDHLPAAPDTGWAIDGGRVWPTGTDVPTAGKSPFLDEETRAGVDFPTGAVASLAANEGLVSAYREYQETMRLFLDQQERLLQQVVAREPAPMAISQPVIMTMPAAGLLPASTPAPADTAALDRARLVDLLIGIVADRTGYAPETLGLDLDLEADLGIDSIKRIELAATLSRVVPDAFEGRGTATLDRLSRLRTLNAIADLLMVPAPSVAREAPLAGGPTSGQAGVVPRSMMKAHPVPLAHAGGRRLAGLHLLTMDRVGAAQPLAESLRRNGATPHLLPADLLADRERLRAHVDDLRTQHGPVTGIIHLAPLGRVLEPTDHLSAWRLEGLIATKSLFVLLQQCADDLASAGEAARVLAVTGMGGSWARQGAVPLGSAMAGGCHGVLRCFEREYPGVRTSTVDVDVTLPAGAVARACADEFLCDTVEPEIGLGKDGRTVFRAVPATTSGAAARLERPSAGWVVLALGGTRGITAEICDEIAAPGVRLILVGRPDGDRPHAADERRRTCEALAARGADVTYEPCDVRDEEAFGRLINNIYDRYGRLDAVIHGAGVIEDQRFDRKTDLSFDRVFDTKVESTLILIRHLRPGGLKWAVFFGSIAGRFGNPGQADYAAANETMSRLACAQSHAWPSTRVVTIHWGPWRRTGMASEAVQQWLAAQGIGIVAPAAGRRFFADELSRGLHDDVEVIAGSGQWTAPLP